MRRILVDHARSRQAAKRGGGVLVESLEDAWVSSVEPDTDVVALDEALGNLAKVDLWTASPAIDGCAPAHPKVHLI